MTVSNLFDKTTATRERPPTNDINADGTFNDAAPTVVTVKIHVARPKEDIALPGGILLEKGDVMVACDKSLDIKEGDFLNFWGRRYEVVAEVHRYDVLQAVTNHGRRSMLARETKRTP